jgi:hypothetical protein
MPKSGRGRTAAQSGPLEEATIDPVAKRTEDVMRATQSDKAVSFKALRRGRVYS